MVCKGLCLVLTMPLGSVNINLVARVNIKEKYTTLDLSREWRFGVSRGAQVLQVAHMALPTRSPELEQV